MAERARRDYLRAVLRSDRGAALGLLALGLISRLPFRSHLLYHWDSVNFALAVEKFDMFLHQPHPPGFFFYVMLGRWAASLVGDVNAGYVWISVLCSALGAAAMFYLGRELFGRRAGVVAALFFLSSPSVWFHGEVALTYALEAFMVTTLVLLLWLMLREAHLRWLVLGSIAMGLSGGFRLPSMVFLAPLYLFCLHKYPWRQVLLALLLVFCCGLAWLLPTVQQMGGLERYTQAVFGLTSFSRPIEERTFNLVVLFFGQDWAIQSVGRLAMYLTYGLLGSLLPLGYLLVKRGLVWLRSLRRLISDERAQVFVLWLMPFLLVWAPRVKASGHTLSFIPALLLLAGWGIAVWSEDLGKHRWGHRVAGVLIVGVILVNVGFFFLAPPYLFGIRRVVFTTPSYPTIRYRDQYLSERIEYIRRNFSPSETAVWVGGPDYRHPDFYLREYIIVRDDSSLLWEKIPAEIRWVVVFSQDLNGVVGGDERAVAEVLPSGDLIYVLVRPSDEGRLLVPVAALQTECKEDSYDKPGE